MLPDDIINYWFEGLTDAQPIEKKSLTYKRWFSGTRRIDGEIRQQFEPYLQKAAAGEYKEWEKSSSGALALIILFDQMARNIYRNTPQMFAYDSLALGLAQHLLKEKLDQSLSLIHRSFVYMPFMHSESFKMQKLSVQQFQQLVLEAEQKSPQNKAYFLSSLDYAQKHSKIIQQFGRFPHRNAILSRVSTPQEKEFLSQPAPNS